MKKAGFIGAGKMAQALAGGIASIFPDAEFLIADPNQAALTNFRTRVQSGRRKRSDDQRQPVSEPVEIAANSQQVFERCETVFLAVKPQQAAAAIAGCELASEDSNLIVSVMAGISIQAIIDLTGGRKVIRLMPNTPCLVAQGATAMACSPFVSAAERENIVAALQAIGIVEQVEENLLDAVTGLSGSGPAYVFLFAEALIQGGIAAGLPSEIANRLARQTLLGAATMLADMTSDPAELRSQVTSPGGTTAVGLQELERNQFELAIVRAVGQATIRARELGQSRD